MEKNNIEVRYDYLKSLIGLNKQEALEKIENDKMPCRIVSVDNEYYMLTMDYQEGRINLQIRNDKISDASFG